MIIKNEWSNFIPNAKSNSKIFLTLSMDSSRSAISIILIIILGCGASSEVIAPITFLKNISDGIPLIIYGFTCNSK